MSAEREEVTCEDVAFASRGATLRGWLYRPARWGAAGPAVVLAHGLSAVREMFLDSYAAAFARTGLTALAYDHFGFGASGGEPRQCPTPSGQLQGYRDAVAWLAGQPGVDPERIGLWGTSWSGGQVMMLAAEDLPIGCAVAQVPALGAGGPPRSAATAAAMDRAIAEDRLGDAIPAASATADGLGMMFCDGAHDWFHRVRTKRAPRWRNEVRIAGLIEAFRPVDHLAGARVPLLLIVAADDRLTPPGAAIDAAGGAANVEVVTIPGDHFAAYESGFAASSRPAVAWFARHL